MNTKRIIKVTQKNEKKQEITPFRIHNVKSHRKITFAANTRSQKHCESRTLYNISTVGLQKIFSEEKNY